MKVFVVICDQSWAASPAFSVRGVFVNREDADSHVKAEGGGLDVEEFDLIGSGWIDEVRRKAAIYDRSKWTQD